MGDNRLLDALTCHGVLASVSVLYWRARKKLSPADLGLSDDKANRRLISLGHKRLLPKERLAGLALIESRAHALLEANTFPFLNGIARYRPNERLAEVDAALADLQRQFETEQREFLRSYGAYRAEALDEWRIALVAQNGPRKTPKARKAEQRAILPGDRCGPHPRSDRAQRSRR